MSLLFGVTGWRSQMSGFICGTPGCEAITEYEGECVEPDCSGRWALLRYAHDLDPAWTCDAHGERWGQCPDLCPPVIALFICQTCGSVQEPAAEMGQQGLF